jgi:hypothetical protein
MAQGQAGEVKGKVEMEDLRKKFIELNTNLGVTNATIGKLQNALGQEQAKAQQIIGALQNTGDMMILMVGVDEAQKIINEIQKPKQEAIGNGKEN